MNWTRFLLTMALIYLAVNAMFAAAYYLDPLGIENANPGSFSDCFYFSLQTMASIGYGKMAPRSGFVHFVAMAESMTSLLGTALFTGMVIMRISRPRTRIIFSRVAVISLRDGLPTLLFRVGNEHGNQVAEAQLSVVLFRSEKTQEGEPVRRFYDLPLWRQRSPVFALSFTAVHQIQMGSALYGQSRETLEAADAEILVSITGLDSAALTQTVHARHAYRVCDLRWNERFVDLFGIDPRGRSYLDYRKFHETTPVDPAHTLPAT